MAGPQTGSCQSSCEGMAARACFILQDPHKDIPHLNLAQSKIEYPTLHCHGLFNHMQSVSICVEGPTLWKNRTKWVSFFHRMPRMGRRQSRPSQSSPSGTPDATQSDGRRKGCPEETCLSRSCVLFCLLHGGGLSKPVHVCVCVSMIDS